jgi:hypothetical protein
MSALPAWAPPWDAGALPLSLPPPAKIVTETASSIPAAIDSIFPDFIVSSCNMTK